MLTVSSGVKRRKLAAVLGAVPPAGTPFVSAFPTSFAGDNTGKASGDLPCRASWAVGLAAGIVAAADFSGRLPAKYIVNAEPMIADVTHITKVFFIFFYSFC